MPGRNIPLVTNQIYHVFNRGIASQPVFLGKLDYERARQTIFYYQNLKVPLRYSFFLRLPSNERGELLQNLRKKKEFIIEILCFCFIPNHFHLLVRQLQDGGISSFMSNFTNSYTRYFNTKTKRSGPLFQGKFKAVRTETDEQLIHVSRYIHLNPYTSYVVKTVEELINYPYSSFSEYLNLKGIGVCNKDFILAHFKNSDTYKQFVFDQADYQRQLDQIKHLVLE